MSQTFVIVLRPAEAPDKWTAEAVRECYITATEEHSRKDIGIAEVVPSAHSGGWADAMLEANAQIYNLGEPEGDPPPAQPDESEPDEPEEKEETTGEAIKSMLAIGALGVAEYRDDGTAAYANTAYGARGFRFHWKHIRTLALVGYMEPVIEVEGCNHDPSKWGETQGSIECALGCGALWQAELAPTPDPYA